jgi:hypothetical protein
MTKLILAAMTALNRQVAVPGSSPKRYPEDAVRMGTAGIARISANISTQHIYKEFGVKTMDAEVCDDKMTETKVNERQHNLQNEEK